MLPYTVLNLAQLCDIQQLSNQSYRNYLIPTKRVQTENKRYPLLQNDRQQTNRQQTISSTQNFLTIPLLFEDVVAYCFRHVYTIIKYMITPCLQKCLPHVYRHVYNMFADMFTAFLMIYLLEYICRMLVDMYTVYRLCLNIDLLKNWRIVT